VARPPRLLIPDGIYHVTARGNERGRIYRDPSDKERFLETLAVVDEQRRWRVLAYCLMSNHYHLLVQTPDPNLAAGMRQLNGCYAQAFNRRHQRVGHLFQGGATARNSCRTTIICTRPFATSSGIRCAPASAGVRATGRGRAIAPRSARRSRRRFSRSRRCSPTTAPTSSPPRRRYGEDAERPDAAEPVRHPLVVGDDAFVAGALARLRPAAGVPRRYFRPPRPALSTLLTSTAGEAAIAAAHAHGYSLREIARHLGVNASTVSRRLRRHHRQASESDETRARGPDLDGEGQPSPALRQTPPDRLSTSD
jgi:REP element-mobilizing transposase RayT